MHQCKKAKCQNCSILFIPDHRNIGRQEFCNLPDCRKASKAASQAAWGAKNPDYFKGPVHVERVRQWRLGNPGKGSLKAEPGVLQDRCHQKSTVKQCVGENSRPPGVVLQDSCLAQHPVIIGLIAHFTDLMLQDDIAGVVRRLEQWGQDVLSGSTITSGDCHETQIPRSSRSPPLNPRSIQLGGSPSGS